MTAIPGLPPVILLGGGANALSVARSLGPLGITVYGLGIPPHVTRSRYLRALPLLRAADPEVAMTMSLLGPQTDRLEGAVVLATSDEGISVLARNRAALLERFRLDNSNPDVQLAMLGKLSTYRAAVAANVPTPRFWKLGDAADIDRLRDELVFPLIVKPLLSHRYQIEFPTMGKFRVVSDIDELGLAYREITSSGLDAMLVEKILGPDNLLCSYYTYLDRSGKATFDFTKRIIRRNPPNMGPASYHMTDWNPEVRELALRLFQHSGLRGVANAEFKRDPRDGRLKLMECNARFTDATCLLAAAGMDLGRHVYRQVIGELDELPTRYTTGLHLLLPTTDLRAFLALRRAGELTPSEWIRSLCRRQTFQWLWATDPMPAVARTARFAFRARAVAASRRAAADQRRTLTHADSVPVQDAKEPSPR